MPILTQVDALFQYVVFNSGPPIMMLALFLTAFPPVFGYSSLITMSGYVYGFGLGLFIAYTSALLGSIACFYLCRRWFKVQVRALMAKKQSMKSVVKAVEKRGFKLMVLIRLAPYPFNVMNALLSATHIPLSTFALATALSLTKLALHVYIGSTLSSLAPTITPPEGETTNPDGSLPPTTPVNNNTHVRNLKIVFMVISIIIGFAVGAYVWTVAKREIA
ncbi:MAG: snare associated Golgi protein-domain-containing protein, partial [Linnemannia elongata]